MDTAAEISLIKQSVAEQIDNYQNYTLGINKLNIIATNKRKLGTTNQKLNMETTINHLTYIFEYYIFENMTYPCILGIDNLKKYGMIIDLEKNILNIQGNQTPLNTITSNQKSNNIDKETMNMNITECKKETDNLTVTDIWEYEGNNEYINIINNELIMKNIIGEIDTEETIKDKVKEILLNNENIYNDTITFARGYEHRIEIDHDEPLGCKNYPIPQQYQQQVNIEIEKLLKQGIIERSNSYFINPVVIVKKKDASLRICLDARTLHKRVEPYT